MTIPIYAIVIAVVCFIAIVIFLIFAKRTQHYTIAGTIHIDMSRTDKDICLFTLDMPLDEIKDHKAVLIRVDGGASLKEWDS